MRVLGERPIPRRPNQLGYTPSATTLIGTLSDGFVTLYAILPDRFQSELLTERSASNAARGVEKCQRESPNESKGFSTPIGSRKTTSGAWSERLRGPSLVGIHGHCTPQREARQRLLELAYVAEQAAAVIQPTDLSLWLFTPNHLLDHDSPADRIAAGDYRSVVALLEALADGITV